MPPSSVGQHFIGSPQPDSQLNSNFGPLDDVGNVSGNRCVSDCIPRGGGGGGGGEFDPGPLLPSADRSRRVVVSYKR